MKITKREIESQDGITRTLVILETRGKCKYSLYALPASHVTDEKVMRDRKEFEPYYGQYGY